MTTTRTRKKKIGPPPNSINMLNEPRFDEVRKVFAKRGLGGLPLAAMMRLVLDEWASADVQALLKKTPTNGD